MCHKCAPMYLADLPQDAQDAITQLNTLSHAIDEASRSANKLEDTYRNIGLLYHCTQLPARQSGNFPQTQLDQIKAWFEISSDSEYEVLFGKIHTAIMYLTDLRSTHLRYSGTTEELVERAEVLDASITILSQQINDSHATLEDRAAMVNALFDISRALYETDQQGVRCAWQDASGMDPVLRPVPFRQEREWALFLAWVAALPETGKMAEMDRTVEEVALGLLFGEEEGFEE